MDVPSNSAENQALKTGIDANSETLPPLERWKIAQKECQTFRDAVRKLPVNPDLKYNSYLFKREDLDKLLTQPGQTPGTEVKLDGVRVYIGYDEVEGHMLPRLHMVGCKWDGVKYADFRVPMNLPQTTSEFSTLDTEEPLPELSEERPCPKECGDENLLNTP